MVRQTRMPQIEDLPPLAQHQLRAYRGEAPTAHAETPRRSLLEKLAAFGISRREEEASTPSLACGRAGAAAGGSAQGPLRALHAEYGRPQPRPAAPLPAQGNLDPHGRAQARAPQMEDDQLEIPAFLRRHSS